MATNINIVTDGTLENTKLVVDGKEVTKDEKVSMMQLYAYASYISKYSGETIKGGCGITYEVIKDDGTYERRDYGKTDIKYKQSIGTTVENTDSFTRFIGHTIDNNIEHMVNMIIDHCDKNNLPHPSKDDLISRSISSLKDKLIDLNIKLED